MSIDTIPKFLCNIRKFFVIILDQKLFTTTYTTDENLTLGPQGNPLGGGPSPTGPGAGTSTEVDDKWPVKAPLLANSFWGAACQTQFRCLRQPREECRI